MATWKKRRGRQEAVFCRDASQIASMGMGMGMGMGVGVSVSVSVEMSMGVQKQIE